MANFEGMALPAHGIGYHYPTTDPDSANVTLTDNGSISFAGLSSSATQYGVDVSVSSTGAIAAGANKLNAFHVTMSSKSVLNAIIGYNSGGGSEVGTCTYVFAVHGSKAPTYLLGVGATAAGVGNITTNGFVVTGKRFVDAPSTTSTLVSIKIQVGDSTWYIPAFSSAAIA